MGDDDGGAGCSALLGGDSNGDRGDSSAAGAGRAFDWPGDQANGSAGWRADAAELADGEGADRRGRSGTRSGARAAAWLDRPVRNGRASGMHDPSACLLWAADAGRVGGADVQAHRPSSAAVWSL